MNPEAPIPANVLDAIRAPFADLGEAFVDPPVVQPLGLLLDLAGEAMRARLFVVQGESEDGCLRPDFTIPVVRAHMERGQPSARYCYEGKAFRAAPRGSGRPDEFLQIGLESFGGGASPAADAEVASLAWRAAAAGGRDDLTLILGDMALASGMIDALALAPAAAARLKRALTRSGGLRAELAREAAGQRPSRQGDRLSALLAGLPEAEAAAVLEDVWALAGIQPVGGRTAGEIAHRLVERAAGAETPALSEAAAALLGRFLDIADAPRHALDAVAALGREAGFKLDAALDAWTARLDGLVAGGVPGDRMRLVTAFSRPFGYYDGFLFEVRSAALDEDSPVAAGGRYDSLPSRLGAESKGAVGCMVRPARAWAGAGR
jgi:ATP phosphoribosyltransferase regulatory subunit